MKKLAILLTIALLLVPLVSGLGITPTRKAFEFEPDKVLRGGFTILNSEAKNIEFSITTRGELGQYIMPSQTTLELKTGDASKEVSYEIKLPSSFETPGMHTGEIIVTSLPSKSTEEGAFIDNIVSVVTEVRLRVPYPGIYAEGRLDILDANVNETVKFILPISNFGSQDLSSVKGTILLSSPTDPNLAAVITDEKPIKAKTTEELQANWLASVEPGIYKADATIKYDQKTFTMAKDFAIGLLLVDLVSANVKDFKIGGIAKISLGIKNRWNSKISNVYGSLTVFDTKGSIISQTKSSSIELAGQGDGNLDVFWDTEGMPSGTYPANVSIHYADKKTERPIKLIIGTSGMYAQIDSATGQVISEKTGTLKASPISLILTVQVLFIIIGAGLLFFLWQKFKKQ